jgi:hypothetical protein
MTKYIFLILFIHQMAFYFLDDLCTTFSWPTQLPLVYIKYVYYTIEKYGALLYQACETA